jgi:hypothetical protein
MEDKAALCPPRATHAIGKARKTIEIEKREKTR